MTDKVTIKLRNGPIYASQRNGLITARGVRYAHANRFQPPRPVGTWMEVIDCTGPASICPQTPSRLEAINGKIAAGRTVDEDCLHVSVFAPATAQGSEEKLPVMAWIHGGGYTSGGGDLDCYSGAALAAAEGIVVVTITYRLGILGYQPIDGVAPANLGLLDQMAAMRWVQDNIAAFGGDRERVTLAGESAGADSIYCMFAADGADGLFQRAILQSTPLGARLMERGAMVETLAAVAKEAIGERDAVGMELGEVFEVQKKLAMASAGFRTVVMPFAPTLGAYPLAISQEEFDARVKRAVARVPLFIGYTADEGVAFEGIFGLMRDEVKPQITCSPAEYVTKAWFHDDSDTLWEQARTTGKEAPWFYEFKAAPRGSRFGAAHTIDMPFLLGSWADWRDAPMMQGEDGGECVERMVEKVGAGFKRLTGAFVKGESLGETRFTIGNEFLL